MSILLTQNIFIAGVLKGPADGTLTLATAQEAEYVNRGVARYVVKTLTPGEDLRPANFNAAGTALVDPVTGLALPFAKNFLPTIQEVHNLSLAEPLRVLVLPTPYGVETATAAGVYEFAYGTPVYCARGFNGYKFWMVAAPYPTSAVGPLNPSAPAKYENPTILASNDGESWEVPTGLTNPIATSIGLSDTNSYYADPYIAFNADYSKLYVTFMWTNRTGTIKTSLMVTESSNGITWSTPVSIDDSTDTTTLAPNSPSLFWNGSGWTCITVNTKSVGVSVPNIKTTASATPYTGWSAWAVSTWPHPLSRAWWHGHFVPLSGGGIIGMAVDNSSAGGAIYTLQSFDGGSTFSVQPFSAWNTAAVGGSWYRPSLCICSDGVNQSVKGYFGRIGPLQNAGFYVQKANLQNGGNVLDAVLFSMVAGQSVQSNGALTAWDSFNRADNALTLGTADSGHAWVNSVGTMGIGTNRAYNTTAAGGGAMATIDPALKSYDFSAKIQTLGAEIYLCFNFIDSSNRYRYGWDGTLFKFQKISGGGITLDKSPTVTVASGDSLGVRVQGKYITLFYNGRVIDTYYDSTIINGTGVGFQASGTASYIEQMMVKPL